MRKFHFIGSGLLLSCLIIGLFMVFNNSTSGEEKIIANGKQFDEEYMDNFKQRIIELGDFIQDDLKKKDINARVSSEYANDLSGFFAEKRHTRN